MSKRNVLFVLVLVLTLSMAFTGVTHIAQAQAGLTVPAQLAVQDGRLGIPGVSVSGPVWLVVRGGGDPIVVPVEPGQAQEISVPVDLLKFGASGKAELWERTSDKLDEQSGKKLTEAAFDVIGIAARDLLQPVRDVKSLTVPRVIAAEDGFVVLRNRDAFTGGYRNFGSAPVKKGVNDNVQIAIPDPAALFTFEVGLFLHRDADKPGELNYPGADNPVSAGGVAVIEPVHIGAQFIHIRDQIVGADKTLTVPSAAAQADSWLAVRSGGNDSKVLGFAPLPGGKVTENIQITLNYEGVAPSMAYLQIIPRQGDTLTLPDDAESPDLDPDAYPVLLNEGVITYGMLRSEVKALGGIVIGRVSVSRPAWIRVVNGSDLRDVPDILQFPIPAGVHQNVLIPMDESLLKGIDQLLIQLHEDTGTLLKYEFPENDKQIRDGSKAVVRTLLTIVD